MPAWVWRSGTVTPRHYWALDRLRSLAENVPTGEHYIARADELEMELLIASHVGQSARVQALARRRFGDGRESVPIGDDREARVDEVAQWVLEEVDDLPDEPVVPAESSRDGEISGRDVVQAVLNASGVPGDVKIDARLAAGAATGDRMVFLADRRFGRREIARFAIHEVLGHLTSAANGRSQSLGLLDHGTARSFGDQEGVSLLWEERAGLLDGTRLRILAMRVLAARWLHEGASYPESVARLMREFGAAPTTAVVVAERTYRGGGVARDVCYLRGWLRVRAAVQAEPDAARLLQAGRVGVADLPWLRDLKSRGILRDSPYRPSLVASLRATGSGTNSETSPPSFLTSLTRLEAT